MPQTIPDKYRVKFVNTWDQVVQQKVAKFESVGILIPDWNEKTVDVDTNDQIEWVEDNSRFGNTDAQEVTGGNRRGFRSTFKVARMFSRRDDSFLGALGNPKGEVMTAMSYGWNRKKDDIFIAKAMAPSYSADETAAAVPFPASRILAANFPKPGVVAGANFGLTPWKILEAKAALLRGDVDLDYEDPFIALTPDEENQLIVYAADAPNDVWSKHISEALLDPSKRLMGVFRIIRTNKIPVDAATDIRTIFVGTQQAFRVSPQKMFSDVTIRADKNYNTQAYSECEWGCFRRYDEHVVGIACDRSPA